MIIRRKNERGFLWLIALVVIIVIIAIVVISLLNRGSSQKSPPPAAKSIEPAAVDTSAMESSEAEGEAPAQAAVQAPAQPAPAFSAADPLPPGMPPEEYLDLLFRYPNDPRTRLYIPNYAYTQGMVYAEGNLGIYGQVRTIGAATAAGPGSPAQIGYGAMVTTNPDFLRDRFVPETPRYQILEWKLVD
ncbi:MAG: hypothetical protein HY319_09480 [Armatimonadetes bacterium]|nr:hypothetical protein [Armatimonadota bacterium]